VNERVFDLQAPDESVYERTKGLIHEKLKEAYRIADKGSRRQRVEEILQFTLKEIGCEDETSQRMAKGAFERADREVARRLILETKRRIDGRGYSDIRDISCEVGILPRTHGSALFTRGETQVLAVVTFGTSEDEQKINSLTGETYKSFMLHYNFLPSVLGRSPRCDPPAEGKLATGLSGESHSSHSSLQ